MRNAAFALCLLGCSTPVFAQAAGPAAYVDNLEGPRVGFTVLSDGAMRPLRDAGIGMKPIMSQLGWQWEHLYDFGPHHVALLNEWVLLAGGLEQNLALPSATWLIGVRSHEGKEFGVGPNLSATGFAVALAAGMTMRAGIVNVPIDVAIVPTRGGIRVSMLTGFTLRRH